MFSLRYSFALLSLILASSVQGQEPQSPMVLNHEIITLMDGTPKIDCFKIIKLELGIKELREGDKEGKGLISHQGKLYGLKNLAVLEKLFVAQQPRPIEKDRVKVFGSAYQESIKQACNLLRPYLNEIKEHYAPKFSIRQMYCTLLDYWAKKRKLKTPLTRCEHYNIEDPENLLKKLAPSLCKLDALLNHIALFLMDLQTSCEKSCKQLLEALNDQHKEAIIVETRIAKEYHDQ